MGVDIDQPLDAPADQGPPAGTAGEQDHTNPWVFAGPEADAPVNPEEADDGVA